ncbi:unnamed protein product [Allacma fusca]|uniref:Uncharacterized protein n=1 Tax=Allacma fusca TaxID=39272 RepID=A0A8J2L9G8_9HEXA|nr:unnamed protein product [Allacma fusca]
MDKSHWLDLACECNREFRLGVDYILFSMASIPVCLIHGRHFLMIMEQEFFSRRRLSSTERYLLLWQLFYLWVPTKGVRP